MRLPQGCAEHRWAKYLHAPGPPRTRGLGATRVSDRTPPATWQAVPCWWGCRKGQGLSPRRPDTGALDAPADVIRHRPAVRNFGANTSSLPRAGDVQPVLSNLEPILRLSPDGLQTARAALVTHPGTRLVTGAGREGSKEGTGMGVTVTSFGGRGAATKPRRAASQPHGGAS